MLNEEKTKTFVSTWHQGVPEKSGQYVVIYEHGVTDVYYNAELGLWNVMHEEHCEYAMTFKIYYWIALSDLRALIFNNKN